ncbi:anti-sigma factor antagonist [Streptomyces halobius]|uniref:Anti-sigma factor antagonist n=1 Tax=Streptomyces halobius TaxID=2879846 RepID=A0ABY4M7P8_9ACTN|nr:anti-sigma factor antagonist [Streptomyces halobius]UQA92291.1 anti-sigma factor antagonist [Streptomyces halobius]
MTSAPVPHAITVTHDGQAVVTLEGEQDILTAPRVLKLLTAAAANRDRIVVDLRKVTFMDSTGLEPLVRTARRLLTTGGGITLVIADQRLRKLLAQSRVDDLFTQVSSPRYGHSAFLPAAGA